MRIPAFIILFMAPFLLCSCASLPADYLSLADNMHLGIDNVTGRILNKKVIFIGEGHTNTEDHLVQLEIIRRLHESGKKVAIAMEMFTDRKPHVLGKWSSGAMDEFEFEREYYAEWTVPFDYYEDIFYYARDKRIRIFGINADKAYISNIAKSGLGTVDSNTKKKLGFTVCAEEPQYEKVMKLYEDMTSHTAELPFFCDAQRLRDALMAFNLAGIIGKGEYTVVAIIGSAHASKIAVPKMLERHLKTDYSVLMPGSFRELSGEKAGPEMADYMWY